MSEIESEPRLKHFPVPFFAVVMGLMGLTLALRSCAPLFAPAKLFSEIVMWGGVLVFVILSGFYGAKYVRYRAAVLAEWHHPVRLAFFPAISISILLIAAGMLPTLPETARVVWLLGAALQAILTVSVISGWISHRSFEVGHLTPAWFIPAVGNVIAPIAGAPLGYMELSWLFFSAGLVFWVILLTLVFNRLIFHNPIPGKLFPTLAILVAPPAAAFLAYVNLTGGVDVFARILLNTGYVFAILIAVQVRQFAGLPFALSWWALSFPVAALASASMVFAKLTGSNAHVVAGAIIMAVLLVIMAGLVWRTVLAILRNEICLPE